MRRTTAIRLIVASGSPLIDFDQLGYNTHHITTVYLHLQYVHTYCPPCQLDQKTAILQPTSATRPWRLHRIRRIRLPSKPRQIDEDLRKSAAQPREQQAVQENIPYCMKGVCMECTEIWCVIWISD